MSIIGKLVGRDIDFPASAAPPGPVGVGLPIGDRTSGGRNGWSEQA